MKIKKGVYFFFILSFSLMIGFAATVAIADGPKPAKVSTEADGGASNVATAAVGFNYSTDFEATGAPGGYNTTGYIDNGAGVFPAGCGGFAKPCWGHTTSTTCSAGSTCPGTVLTPSLITPTIDTNFPRSGAQHLRLTPDPSTRTNVSNFGLGVDARFPRTADLSVRPMAANTVSIELSISSPNGQDFKVQPQSNSQGCLATSALFMYDGSIHVLDDVCGSTALQFIDTGAVWDTTGAYQNYTVAMNPCQDTTVYLYGGALLYESCVPAGRNLEQFLIYGDNYPGSEARVDNLVLSSLDGGFGDSSQQLASVCGNSYVEPCNGEQCDGAADAVCPGRCTADCTCYAICTQANPCPVTNGANGPHITSSGYYLYSGTSASISIDTCGSSFDSLLSIATVAAPETLLASNDDCNAGQFGSGVDESASCYDSEAPFHDFYPSCTCVPNPGQPILIRVQVTSFSCGPPPVGHSTMINIRKKEVCAGLSIGACCDTNGADTGCTDNVLSGACTGADKVWTENGKCDEIGCACIPNCAGAICGNNGCGGSCGTCGDNNICNGVETCVDRNCVAGTPLSCNDNNACNGVESCNPASGCMPGNALSCDDGLFCNGIETCNLSSGCVSGTPVNCDDGQDCSVDTCNEPSGTCTHDTSGCSIPTVSEWGLVVVTLLLLVSAKVQFGRRRLA